MILADRNPLTFTIFVIFFLKIKFFKFLIYLEKEI